MQIIGCDLHARQQTLAMLDTGTGEVVNLTLSHEGNSVRTTGRVYRGGPTRCGTCADQIFIETGYFPAVACAPEAIGVSRI